MRSRGHRLRRRCDADAGLERHLAGHRSSMLGSSLGGSWPLTWREELPRTGTRRETLWRLDISRPSIALPINFLAEGGHTHVAQIRSPNRGLPRGWR